MKSPVMENNQQDMLSCTSGKELLFSSGHILELSLVTG